MKRFLAATILTLALLAHTACAAEDATVSIEETAPQSSSPSAASSQEPVSREPSSSLTEPSTASEEPPEEESPPWDPDSPFGIAVENASVQLYKIFPDYIDLHYSVGLADYNLDGIPELFLGCVGGNRGGGYFVFDCTGEGYRELASYFVGSGWHRFEIVSDPYSDARYMTFYSEGGAGFDLNFTTVYFEPEGHGLTTWEHHIQIVVGTGMQDTDTPDEYYLRGDRPGLSLWNDKATDPALITEMKRKWFDKLWYHHPAPAVETEKAFPKPAPEVTDPDVTKALVYSLANEYYEKFPDYIALE